MGTSSGLVVVVAGVNIAVVGSRWLGDIWGKRLELASKVRTRDVTCWDLKLEAEFGVDFHIHHWKERIPA